MTRQFTFDVFIHSKKNKKRRKRRRSRERGEGRGEEGRGERGEGRGERGEGRGERGEGERGEGERGEGRGERGEKVKGKGTDWIPSIDSFTQRTSAVSFSVLRLLSNVSHFVSISSSIYFSISMFVSCRKNRIKRNKTRIKKKNK